MQSDRPHTTTATTYQTQLRPTFVLYGDSLTQFSFNMGGWGAGVACRYQRTADVVLRGYSGYNTTWALPQLATLFPSPDALSRPAPSLVTVFFGANDAVVPGCGEFSRQHVELGAYTANLTRIVEHVQGMGLDPHGKPPQVVLITPPPVDEEAWFRATQATHGTPDIPEARRARNNATTGEYARAVVALAKSLQLPVVDLHSAMMAQPDWKGLLSDGLHFNDKGQVFVYGAVSEVIDIAAPHLKPEHMAPDFPDWKAIDLADPSGCITEYLADREMRTK